jgi:hypothetical protein
MVCIVYPLYSEKSDRVDLILMIGRVFRSSMELLLSKSFSERPVPLSECEKHGPILRARSTAGRRARTERARGNRENRHPRKNPGLMAAALMTRSGKRFVPQVLQAYGGSK